MRSPVIAGTDGSPVSMAAVGWAAREATYRQAPLVIVHAIPRWAVDTPVNRPPQAEEQARAILETAERQVRARNCRQEVSTEILDGRAEEALAERAVKAQLLVVGDKGRGEFAALLLGSVSRTLAVRAHCPIVVVGKHLGADRGEVVAGITGEPGQDLVLAFAFEEAAVRDVPLRALHAWTHPESRGPGDFVPPVYDAVGVEQEERRLLAELLAGWRAKYPDVPVIEDVRRERPVNALVGASERAAVAVVGAHGGLIGLVAAAAVHPLLRQARCPVAVVHY